MSSAENVNDVSINQLASKCRQEHLEVKNNILTLKNFIESSIALLSRDELMLVGANIQTLSNLLSVLDSYIAAIQVSEDAFQPWVNLFKDVNLGYNRTFETFMGLQVVLDWQPPHSPASPETSQDNSEDDLTDS